MSGSLNAIGAITLFVADPVRSKAFYERAFGVPLLFEDADSAAFRLENCVLNLLADRAAPELVEPSPIGPRDAGARFQLTIWVDDADGTCAELATRGVELLNGPQDRPWGVRTAAFADPDGHVWEVAQEIHAGG
jgi:catechol 2,3-dioxygenase-like lactoylglutathione lyase family enzyme